MTNKNTPKRHHFVPRWYLELFVNPADGFLELFDKSQKKWRRQKPNKVMVINNYYRQLWAPEGTDVNIIEIILGSQIEPQAKNAFDKIFNQEQLSNEDVGALIAFIEIQRLRVPQEAKKANQLTEALMLKYIHEHPDFKDISIIFKTLPIKIEILAPVRFEYMKTVIGVFSSIIPHMLWEIVTPEHGSSFLTTDSPVTLYNSAFLPPFEPGIKHAGTQVIFPLSPKKLLILAHPSYAYDKTVDPQEHVDYEHIDSKKNQVLSGRELPIEGVKKINWMLLQLSDKYIVASDKKTIEEALAQGSSEAIF